MDLYKFISSRDIRAYLKEIKYEFTPCEMVYFIDRSNGNTLEEKLDAWQELLSTTEDCEIAGKRAARGAAENGMYSLHDLLRRHIGNQKKNLCSFYQKEGYIYCLEIHEWTRWSKRDEGEYTWTEDGNYFPTVEAVLEYWDKILQDNEGDACSADKIRIYKKQIYKSERSEKEDSFRKEQYRMTLSAGKEVYDVEGDLQDSMLVFEDMWFAVPTPFKRGDIVWSSCENWFCSRVSRQPFVLEYIKTWDTKEMLENGITGDMALKADKIVQEYREYGDVSNLGAYGRAISEDFGIWGDMFGNACYLDLEYYRKPLEKHFRVLKPISEFLRNNIDLELLLNSYTQILAEETCRKRRGGYAGEYTREGLN